MIWLKCALIRSRFHFSPVIWLFIVFKETSMSIELILIMKKSWGLLKSTLVAICLTDYVS